MLVNNFTPVFGGKPTFFFGRKAITERLERALEDRGSEDRALFVTGTRGCGKTALVEQLSLRAAARGWRTIDLGPENAVRSLTHRLSGRDEETKTVDPRVSVSVLGSGGSVGGMSTSRTRRWDESDLDILLIDACARERRGVMVTVDEIQKLSEGEASAISNAFQMASRKGCDAILVVAGLPFAHPEVISYRGCTFMRRSAHVKLGLLHHAEVEDAFLSGMPEGMALGDDELASLVAASSGHPYLVQLLGFYLVEAARQLGAEAPIAVTKKMVSQAIAQANEAYESRALKPMVEELSPLERSFLSAMAQELGPNRTARTADIGTRLGRTAKQLSYSRDKLLKVGVIVAAGRGNLMFAVPHLAAYLLNPPPEEDELAQLRSWGI